MFQTIYMKPWLILFLLGAALTAKSQPCSCGDEFIFIKQHIEKNHGGFNKKIKSPEAPAYKRFCDQLRRKMAKLTDSKYCIAYLKQYILYLQDHHSNITGNTGQPVLETDSAAVARFLAGEAYTNSETVIMDQAAIDKYLAASADPVEGIYTVPGNIYKVALLKNKTPNRDYAGIIVESATRLWTPGQVKFELKKESESLYHYYGYLRNHAMVYEQLTKTGTAITIPGWIKQDSKANTAGAGIDNELIRFAILDSETTLLSIRSFGSDQYKKLDSAYKAVLPQIKKHRRLIIDVRNNGGGADFTYGPLMPLLYTDTIYNDVVDIYNTPANKAAYQRFDSISVKNGNAAIFFRSRSLMDKATPYSFVPMGTGKVSTTTYPVHKGYPEKIAILYNRGCASSCESFLLDARYSSKTILVGENSGGYTGYGDVMSIQTPCGNTLSWTTTVYRDRWKYEFVGIPPTYRISTAEKDWVNYTRMLLAK
jgi:hypothetical protein